MDPRSTSVCELTLQDFTLVTTYLPILGLTLCDSLLVSVMYWSMYTAHILFPSVIMLSTSKVYLDSLSLRLQLDPHAAYPLQCRVY
jgi:hypothetical protein